jgi:short subunit dehydrogenase-like uncharacterized protein
MEMKDKKIIIYGANGYTAKLFAKHLLQKGLQPILSARSNKVKQIGKELNCSYRIFTIEDADQHLEDIDILINFAGPFSITQAPLIKACIASKTHYVDIVGEFDEMKNAFKYNTQAQQAGIVLLPAAGFGVVPTDIAAKIACDLIEQPSHLTIAYATVGGVSRGTLKTLLKDIQKSGYILINGKYQKAQPAQSEIKVDVLGKSFKAVYNPWRADLYTAKISTGVENIETYSEFPSFVVSMMKGKLNWLRRLILNRLLNFLPEGSTPKQLKTGNTYVKVIAKNQKGERGIVELKGSEAYLFTIQTVHKMIELVVSQRNKNGFLTPSMLGTDWLAKMTNVELKQYRE